MFSMDTFVQKLQPERYKLWIKGADVGTHPEDPSYSYPAPMPSKKDILCSKKYIYIYIFILLSNMILYNFF